MLNSVSTASQTSAQSLVQIGNAGKKTMCDKILDICIAAQRRGQVDFSGKEIQARYEAIHGKRIESGTVSARVNELVTAKRLDRSDIARMCTVSARDIYPVRVPATQARLIA